MPIATRKEPMYPGQNINRIIPADRADAYRSNGWTVVDEAKTQEVVEIPPPVVIPPVVEIVPASVKVEYKPQRGRPKKRGR
jgi:hypothetical protein